MSIFYRYITRLAQWRRPITARTLSTQRHVKTRFPRKQVIAQGPITPLDLPF